MNTFALPELFDRLGTPERMRQLAGYDLFAPGLSDRLNAIAARTAQRLDAPVSLVSVILDSSQWIVGGYGIQGWVADVQGTPAEWALCTHTVLTGRPYCVASAAESEHADNPLVRMTGLRSYAGMPLQDGSGHTLGAHCVMDVGTRVFHDDELAVLRDGADEIMTVLAGVRQA
ncbi:GAF domain-containing protein [Actinoplanes sp. NPDC020271]|uniref:GAF domain-containing protein n=1 Tax=Actinoplanes sp. NPDC020271 TaxID=3363896 RepID=UPI0037AF85C2